MPIQTNPYAPAPQNTSYSGSVSSAIIQPTIVAGINDLAFAQKPPVMVMRVTGTNDIEVLFSTYDGVQNVTMQFAPEPDMGVSELSKIMLLIGAGQQGKLLQSDPLNYVRKHSLERHFKFTV